MAAKANASIPIAPAHEIINAVLLGSVVPKSAGVNVANTHTAKAIAHEVFAISITAFQKGSGADTLYVTVNFNIRKLNVFPVHDTITSVDEYQSIIDITTFGRKD